MKTLLNEKTLPLFKNNTLKKQSIHSLKKQFKNEVKQFRKIRPKID